VNKSKLTLGETFIVGGDSPDAIEVTLVRLRGSNIQLEIRAPRDVPVHRLEVHERTVANGP
jgi:sRNA-binding carbon storage regulator CsrA